MNKKIFFLFMLILILLKNSSHAQSVHNDIFRELAITQRLLGKLDTANSFKQNKINLLPIVLNQWHNSELPTGYNLGSGIKAKGSQILLSAGLQAKLGKYISIKINPEFVSAQNANFEQFSQTLGDRTWADYYRFLNTIDLPTQMGEGVYTKLMPGQSHFKYQLNKQLEVGISTENIWWGPGWKNALIMSYNAPGFLHFTFNTTKPIQTKWGKLLGQWIGGKLNESGILPPRINSAYNGQLVYQPKKTEDRLITGINLSWIPKWTPNLTIGYSGAAYFYTSDIFGNKASLGAVYAQYQMPADLAELYIEYGVKAPNFRRAYVAGFRKLFPTKNDAHIQLAVELTQLQAGTAELIRNPNSWYTDPYVRQGYTHFGKTIGAGIGPGSNSQNIEIAWVKGNNKIGLQFERLRHNSDFYYFAFERIGDFRRHWVDLSTSANASINFKKFWVNARLQLIRTYNYQWLIIQTDPTNYFQPGNEYLNISGGISFLYRL